MHTDQRPDIVVIGGSAGGLDAVIGLLTPLPSDLAAAVFVVLHVPPDASGDHIRIIDRACALPVRAAEDGERAYHGHVYVAPPDRHLVLMGDHMSVARGPRENCARPAIDPLFRSAAAVYGPRSLGVLLTGYLDDGVAGLAAIHRAGGVTAVQDPDEAEVPEMPSRALQRVHVDHRLPVHRLAGMILDRSGTSASRREPSDTRRDPDLETLIAAGEDVDMDTQERLGDPAGLGCPECGGPLALIDDPDVRRYRCHIGHAYTDRALLRDQADQVERALGAALRALEERASLLDGIAGDLGADPSSTQRGEPYRERADVARHHAEVLRQLLLHGSASGADAA